MRNVISVKYLSIIVLGVFFASAACVKPQAGNAAVNADTTETVNVNAANQPAAQPAPNLTDANANVKTFLGYVGDNLVQLHLTRDGSNISGNYSYDKVGTGLKLSGTIDAAGKFTLQETDQTGKKTGEFKGNWKETDGHATLTGDWKSANGKTTLNFSADEQVSNFTNGTKIATKSSHEANKAKHFQITNQYPELTGVEPATAAKFNELAKKIVTDANAAFKENISDLTPDDLKRFTGDAGLYDEVTYNVLLANDDVMSLLFTDANYTGGVHPNTTNAVINYDLKNNRELKLADLFEPKSNYLKTISDYSLASLKKDLKDMLDDQMLNDGASPKEDNYKNWNLTKKGLQINFEAYQVAAYAAGPQTVVIPYVKLQNIMRPEIKTLLKVS